MAEKTLNTRILLKYDTLTNWEKDLGYLRKGEVAIATVTTDTEVSSASKLTGGEPPQVLIKVGDGSHKFSELPYITAKAGDVYSWAKEKNLKYEALPETLRDEIDALQAAVGAGGSVSVQIENAIKTLDVEDKAADNQFVVAVPQVDGKVAPVRRALVKADIPVIDQEQVNGLEDDLKDLDDAIKAEASARGTAIEGAKSHAQGLVNGLANGAVATNTAAIAKLNGAATEEGSIAKVLADAKTYAESEAADAEAAAKAEAVAKANAAEANAKAHTNTEIGKVTEAAGLLAGRVKAIEDDYLKAADKTELVNATGTVATNLANEITRATDAEAGLAGDIARVEGVVNNFFSDEAKIEGTVDTLKEIQNYITTHGEAAADMVTAIQENKEAIEAEVERATKKEGELNTAISDEEGRAKGEEARIEGLANAAQSTANGAQGGVNTINEKIGTVPTGKTLVQMISDAKTEATYDDTQVKADIQKNAKAIADEIARATGAEAQVLADAKSHAQGLVDGLANGQVTTNKTNIETLTTKIGDAALPTGQTTLIGAINANKAAIDAEIIRAKAAEKANADAIADINADKTIVKSVKFENVKGGTPAVLTGAIANNELTIKFDDTLTFILNAGNAATADQLDATAQG